MKETGNFFMNRAFFTTLFVLLVSSIGAVHRPEFSSAGFFPLKNSGRDVFSMNPAWRFFKGDIKGAERVDFDDSYWVTVSLPHGIEYLPTEASGCINYQGVVWYRKHFTPDSSFKEKKLFLHFEAIMGKSKVFVNGELVTEHFGGYLPVVVDITDKAILGKDNVIAVAADNSNDPAYPPGKAQDVLDFTYFGGIYRDCWLISHNRVFITDPNFEKEAASGGVFVAYDEVSEKSADVILRSHIKNDADKSFSGVLEYEIINNKGKNVASKKRKIKIASGSSVRLDDKISVKNPELWSPDAPTLYNLSVKITDNNGNAVDGYRKRIGIRSIEFKGKDGFWLNGKPYGEPIIGANRHQDFAVVGNAVPNSLHWRDAKKLRDAGLRVIRNAHCPQDPAFMDACDELGLFVINNTPGWQFWNDTSVFEQRVYDDIRNLVRRDRNNPSVWLWEPILNETWYPEDFAKNAANILKEEYPFKYCYGSSDSEARGNDNFTVLFSHPSINKGDKSVENDTALDKVYFTREFGDNVDDWYSHNSPSRVARNWGERPMLVQATHYANPAYPYTSYNELYRTSKQHVGGCLWHSFDHQRGYHPDPFYGGIMDVFRQPKYSYYMFMSQRAQDRSERIYETGPMVYIANEMTPFSDKDVTVYSNCDEVRLTFNNGGETKVYKQTNGEKGMPHPIIIFKDAYDFMTDKALSRQNKQKDVYLYAEGLIDGKVVAVHKVAPARRPEKILLWVDNEGMELKADGSDMVTVVAAISDKNGNIKRLNNYYIKFSIEGEGSIVGGSDVLANPAPVRWGTAPILVKSTLKPGKIKVMASVLFEGSQMPVSEILELESVPTTDKLLYDKAEISNGTLTAGDLKQDVKTDVEIEKENSKKRMNAMKLEEVARQQEEFGEKK